ncbi:unnamed protein product [Rotaria magnacalcarata]|uniref:Helix-turn-helix domain-containing protein n=1 Tax=Rotaria magnacalcarata TaxID=392030 RepID=A0A819Z3I7_9BILA|nr:unnamed protein product [Rotaria magnacalcarata]CAF4168015.1 unnamed protein product [Rotaria magnacalcarata]
MDISYQKRICVRLILQIYIPYYHREESLDILVEFLLQHGYQKIQNIPIDIIRKYVDDIIFTSNDSLESIHQMLDEANNFHPNIKLVRQIGSSVPFLDEFMQNSNGALITSVYHKEAADSYFVPFGSDHPGHIFRNTVDAASTRAVRYSTALSQFEEEIRQMKLMFLYNGYPPRHIDWRISTLFSHQLLGTSTHTEYDKTTDNSIIYHQTRDKNMQNQFLQPMDNNELATGKRLIIH